MYSFSNGYASFSSVWFFEKVVFDSPLLPLVAVGFFGVWMARTTTLVDDFFASLLLRRLFFPRWFNLFPPEKQIASVAENGIALDDDDDIAFSKSGECVTLCDDLKTRGKKTFLCAM